MNRVIPFLYGLVSYGVALGAMFYGIGFVGNILVPTTVDSGGGAAGSAALIVDLGLLGLFAIQHSVMARPAFKRWWTRIVPPPIERSTYVLLTGLLLLLLFWQWQPLPGILWNLQSPIAQAVLWGLFGLGWLLVILATFLINHFDLFGLRQVYAHLRARPLAPLDFKTSLLYRVVRHPLMLGFLIAFWATPRLTPGHLLFALASTGYILIAVQLEERDLVRAYGATYQRYQQEVPMLIPRPRRQPRPPPAARPAGTIEQAAEERAEQGSAS